MIDTLKYAVTSAELLALEVVQARLLLLWEERPEAFLAAERAANEGKWSLVEHLRAWSNLDALTHMAILSLDDDKIADITRRPRQLVEDASKTPGPAMLEFLPPVTEADVRRHTDKLDSERHRAQAIEAVSLQLELIRRI